MHRTVLALAVLASTVVGAAPANASCIPASTSIAPGPLTWDVYRGADLGTAYYWHGSGLAVVSDDCASRLDLQVQVTDYPRYGDVETSGGAGTDTTASDGEFRAFARADAFVVYYEDVPTLHRRGRTVVEVRVTATYVDPTTQATVPLGCAMTRTSVTPLPATDPITSTGPVEDCS